MASENQPRRPVDADKPAGGSAAQTDLRDRCPVIPDHQLLSPIASGAYGEVWLARNAVGTMRAVKIVRRDRHASFESFVREFKGLQKFEPVSRTHDGLVDVLTLGILPEGLGFYYVMELADAIEPKNSALSNGAEGRSPPPEDGRKHPPIGLARNSAANGRRYEPRTLRAELHARGALPAGAVIEIGLEMSAALAHLHAQGLVHRDVKPSNVLYLGGRPKLADAGLVAAMDDARSLVGTAGYIAPEGPGTPQADVYALGKVLYEAALGKDRREFPTLPLDIQTRPDHHRLLELNEVLLKACASDWKKRYPSAQALHAELRFLESGQSIRRRRSRRIAASVAWRVLMGGALLSVLVLLLYSWRAAEKGSFLPKRSPVKVANEEYQLGISCLHTSHPDAPAQAIPHFEKALASDPHFAAAHLGMAQAWLFMAGSGSNNLHQAQAALQNALRCDQNLSEAHALLSAIKIRLDLDWDSAEEEVETALNLGPNSADTLYECALSLALLGHRDRAVRILELAMRNDPPPYSIARLRHAGHVYTWARLFDEGIRKYTQVIEIMPASRAMIGYPLARAYLGNNEYIKAIRLQAGLDAASSTEPEKTRAAFAALEQAYLTDGETGYWRKRLEQEAANPSRASLMVRAAIHAHLAQNTQAIQLLQRAFQETPSAFAFAINTDPAFDRLHTEPGFLRLMEQLHHRRHAGSILPRPEELAIPR